MRSASVVPEEFAPEAAAPAEAPAEASQSDEASDAGQGSVDPVRDAADAELVRICQGFTSYDSYEQVS